MNICTCLNLKKIQILQHFLSFFVCSITQKSLRVREIYWSNLIFFLFLISSWRNNTTSLASLTYLFWQNKRVYFFRPKLVCTKTTTKKSLDLVLPKNFCPSQNFFRSSIFDLSTLFMIYSRFSFGYKNCYIWFLSDKILMFMTLT